MMTKMIDARGLACPQPVVLTKREFDNGAVEITTLVDNEAARENLTRLGQSLGCNVNVVNQDNDFQVVLKRGSEPQTGRIEFCPVSGNDVVLIASELFGRGEAELGAVLMKSFLYALNEVPGAIKTLIFINSGVKLACTGSPVLDLLQNISAQGIEIYSCGTCLDYYQLKEELKVGVVTNMYSALEMMQQAGKVINV